MSWNWYRLILAISLIIEGETGGPENQFLWLRRILVLPERCFDKILKFDQGKCFNSLTVWEICKEIQEETSRWHRCYHTPTRPQRRKPMKDNSCWMCKTAVGNFPALYMRSCRGPEKLFQPLQTILNSSYRTAALVFQSRPLLYNC